MQIEETIQSQYAASPRIKAIAKSIDSLIRPNLDIELFYNNAFNLATAQGWGLDCWGRIVAIERKIEGVPTDDNYLGFTAVTGIPNTQAQPFNNAPFFSKQVGNTFVFQDDAFRLLILTKAMANISEATLPQLNHMISMLLPNANVYVLHIDTMHLRIVIQDYLEPYQRILLTRGDLPPIPAGVGFEVYELDPHTFGFNGSRLEPFNQGVFALRK